MSNTLVVIPTYNESQNITRVLKAALSAGPDFHLLVVDDNSPDGTAELVKDFASTSEGRIFLLERSGKLGLGTAYIAGFKWGLERNYSYIFEMDADFSHNPLDLPRLLQVVHSGQADVAVGSRYVKEGKIENWPFLRLFISYGASLYVRIITQMPIKDPTAGFICYKAEVLKSIDLDKVRFIGYAFQIEMKYKAYCNGFKIREIPITFADRIEGSSKMSKAIVREAIFGVLRLRWRRIKGEF